jgi:RNA polymerase sigma-70 factor, ECF subfamily
VLRSVRESDLLRAEGRRPLRMWVPLMLLHMPVHTPVHTLVPTEPERRAEAGRLVPSSMSSKPDWGAFYGPLRSFVAARVRSAAETDDVVQRILERALAKTDELREADRAAAWLFALARNAVADHYRGLKLKDSPAVEELESPWPEPATIDEERAFVLGCMQPLLLTLDADSQQLLRWADVEERPLRFIADRLGLSLTAVKSRVQRARKAFLQATRRCCAVTLDARGRVQEFTPKQQAMAACRPCDESTPNACGKQGES